MIQANHKTWGRVIFDPYIDRLLKKSFSNFYLVNEIPPIPSNRSLVVTPNHISWWDGFFIYALARHVINKKIHLMMLQEQLEKHWYFSRIGAYSIHPGQKTGVFESFDYTVKLLHRTQNMVVMYPQGEIEPFWQRPLSLKPGLKFLLSKKYSDAAQYAHVLLVGFCVNFFDKKEPEIVCRFGDLLEASWVAHNYKEYERKFIKNLNALALSCKKRDYNRDLFAVF